MLVKFDLIRIVLKLLPLKPLPLGYCPSLGPLDQVVFLWFTKKESSNGTRWCPFAISWAIHQVNPS